MNESNILTIIILLAVFLVLVAFGLIFISRAFKNFSGHKKVGFEPLLYVQKKYEKIRKVTRVPCGIAYIIASDNEKPQNGGKKEQAYAHLGDTLLASFDEEDDLVSKINSKEYIILTRRSEAKLNAAIDQIIYDVLLYSKTNAVPNLTVNFGAYLIPAGTIDFEETVLRAKLAASEAKSSDRKYVAWDYNLQSGYDNRILIEENLKNGIENNNFFLEFQPIIDIATGNIVGGEVLTRLNSESKIILPDEFISVVKDKKMDSEFDCHVFEKTCQWISSHKDACKHLSHISVNFSRNTLAQQGISEKILEIADKHGVDRSFIAVEVLEDRKETPYDSAIIRENLETLKKYGVSVSLDDFGDGYSSFDDLKNYPVDVIKMSKAVTDNIETQLGLRIFKSIVSVADSMNVSIICEGAETLRQINILRDNDIKYVQGYFFYRPVSPDQFEKAIFNNRNKQGDK